MIFIEHDAPLTREKMQENLQLLQQAVTETENGGGSELVRNALKSVVATYRDPEEINSHAEESAEMKSQSES